MNLLFSNNKLLWILLLVSLPFTTQINSKSIDHIQRFYHHPDWLPTQGDAQLLKVIKSVNYHYQRKFSLNDQELYSLYLEDQSDRAGDWWAVNLPARDNYRLRIVELKLKHGLVRTSLDFFHAAIIMHHGGKQQNYRQAVSLSKKAIALNPMNAAAHWLNCAANNRLQVSISQSYKQNDCGSFR